MNKKTFIGYLSMVILVIGITASVTNVINKKNNDHLTQRQTKLENKLATKKSKIFELENANDKLKTSTNISKSDVVNIDVINSTTGGFVNAMYTTPSNKLIDRYNNMKRYLSGEALAQLKPKDGDTPNLDNDRNTVKISKIHSYIDTVDDSDKVSVITEYLMTSNVGDNEINSNMVLKTEMLKSDNKWTICNLISNTTYTDRGNLSNAK